MNGPIQSGPGQAGRLAQGPADGDRSTPSGPPAGAAAPQPLPGAAQPEDTWPDPPPVLTADSVADWAGDLLRLARARTGVTRAQLAALAGVPRSSVERIEAGTRQPSLPTLVALLAAVDLEPRIRLERRGG